MRGGTTWCRFSRPRLLARRGGDDSAAVVAAAVLVRTTGEGDKDLAVALSAALVGAAGGRGTGAWPPGLPRRLSVGR